MGSRLALLPGRPGEAEPQGPQANDQGSDLPRWWLQPQLSPGPTGEARGSDSPGQPHGGAPGLCFRNNPKTKATSWLPQLSLQHARTEPPRAQPLADWQGAGGPQAGFGGDPPHTLSTIDHGTYMAFPRAVRMRAFPPGSEEVSPENPHGRRTSLQHLSRPSTWHEHRGSDRPATKRSPSVHSISLYGTTMHTPHLGGGGALRTERKGSFLRKPLPERRKKTGHKALQSPEGKVRGREHRRQQEGWLKARRTPEGFSEEVAFKVALRYRRLWEEGRRAFQAEDKGIPADLY